MQLYKEFLESVDKEIDSIIGSESKRLTSRGQNELHLLFENRNAVEKMLKEHGAGYEYHNSPAQHSFSNPPRG